MNPQSRRRFIKTSLTASMSTPLVNSILPSTLFVHHVLFYLKNPASEADKAKLLEGLTKLAKCSTIKLANIGTPAATNRAVIERAYTYSWLCFFESPTDEEAYQKDPIHDDFRTNYAHLWEKVVIYDSIGETQ